MKILLTVFAYLIVVALGVVGFIYSGIFDVAAADPESPLLGWTRFTFSENSVIARLGGVTVPAGLDRPEVLQAGGKLFDKLCAICHRGPGQKPGDVAQGLNPPADDLFRPARHAHMNGSYWFIKYGVKMSGMPGFGKTYSEDDIWALAVFLQHGPGMSPQDYAALTGAAVPPAATGSDSPKANGG